MEVDIFDEIQRLRQAGRKAALATIVQIRGSVPSFQSAKMLIREDGSTMGSVGGGCVEAEVWTAAQDVLREEKARVMSFDLTDESMAESGLICGGKVEIFVEPILPTPKMVIFGAGHIATQVSKIATIAGFRTTIVDNRPVYANAERFPEAESIYSESFEEAFEKIVPTDNTYLIIVTRGHQEDQNVLRWAVQTDARYIGMIGSKRKIRSIADQLESEGISRERLERVYMPIGLDIGAVLPKRSRLRSSRKSSMCGARGSSILLAKSSFKRLTLKKHVHPEGLPTWASGPAHGIKARFARDACQSRHPDVDRQHDGNHG